MSILNINIETSTTEELQAELTKLEDAYNNDSTIQYFKTKRYSSLIEDYERSICKLKMQLNYKSQKI